MFRGEATPFCYDGGGSWGEGEANEIWVSQQERADARGRDLPPWLCCCWLCGSPKVPSDRKLKHSMNRYYSIGASPLQRLGDDASSADAYAQCTHFATATAGESSLLLMMAGSTATNY